MSPIFSSIRPSSTSHELRAHINAQFEREEDDRNLTIASVSFGFKNGVPTDADLVFDVRFLPNPHFIPEFRKLTGRHPKVARYIREFPQTAEFLDKATDMLQFLLPHYIKEGKSYLTVAFGCTGGQHRSVFIAEEMKKAPHRAGLPREDRASRHASLTRVLPHNYNEAMPVFSMRAPGEVA